MMIPGKVATLAMMALTLTSLAMAADKDDNSAETDWCV